VAKTKNRKVSRQKGGDYGRQGDYVRHGSPAHADLLMIREADEDDEFVKADSEGRKWALMDITAFGVLPDQYLKRILSQKVNELTTPVPKMQSVDIHAPNYAVPMWDPEGVLA